jgi:hypothetical protein
VGSGVNSITDLVCLLLQVLKLHEALISEAMPKYFKQTAVLINQKKNTMLKQPDTN